MFGANALDVLFEEVFGLLFPRAFVPDPFLNLVKFSLSNFLLLLKAQSFVPRGFQLTLKPFPMIMMLLTRKIHLDTELGIVDLADKVEVCVHKLAFGREYREALETWVSVCPTGVLISDCSECLTDVDPEIGGHVPEKLKSDRTLLMVCVDIGLNCGAINDLDRGPRR